MRRIDILKSGSHSYSFEAAAARDLHQALGETDITSQIIALDEGNIGTYFQDLLVNPPCATLSFTNLFPAFHFFSANARLPHILIKEGHIGGGFSSLKNPLNQIYLPCRATVSYLQSKGSTQVHFAPSPPLWRNSSIDRDAKRPYDAVLFNDLVEKGDLFKTWERIFSRQEAEFLRGFLENPPPASTLESLIDALKHSPLSNPTGGIDHWLTALEEALPIQPTLDLIESIPNVHFHLFGEHIGNCWLTRLQNRGTIFLHDLLPYSLHFEVLKRAKILIRPKPFSKDGADPWILPAINAGSLFLTPKNPFLEEMLGKDSPCFYPEGDFYALEEKLHFYLEREKEREEIIRAYHPLLEKYEYSYL